MWNIQLPKADEMWNVEPNSGMEGLADRAPDKLVVEGGPDPGEEAQVEQTRIAAWFF